MRGDRYQEKRFSVPASAGKLETCTRVGHSFADRKGRCVRCGNKIRHTAFDATPTKSQTTTELVKP